MNKTNYVSVVNAIGLIALLLGVFLTFTAIKSDLDNFNFNKDSFKEQYDQSKEMLEQTMNYKKGIGTEDLSADDLMYLQTLSDSTISGYVNELETEYQKGLTELKSQMWNDIFTSTGGQFALIILGIALIFVSKSLRVLEENIVKE